MKYTKKGEVGRFTLNRNMKSFFDTFDFKQSDEKYQCLKCEAWKVGDKLKPVGQFDKTSRRVFVFRFCENCWQSYAKASPELKKVFIENMRRKIKTASEVNNV